MPDGSFLRALQKGGLKIWIGAAYEVMIVGIVSLLPLLVAASRSALLRTPSIAAGEAFSKAFLSGQLLFYAMGFIATVIWQCNSDFVAFSTTRRAINVLCVAVVATCTLVIADDPSLVLENSFIAPVSIATYAISALLYFVMAAIGQAPIDIAGNLAQADAELTDQVRLSREHGQ